MTSANYSEADASCQEQKKKQLHSAAGKANDVKTSLYLRVIVYFREQVSKPLYAVVAVVSLCVQLPLDHVPGTCQFHATWVDGNRKACFLLLSAE